MNLPQGFQYAGLHCGIKPGSYDLCLIVADQPCVAVGTYTQNVVRAACIDWNRQITPTPEARAVIINSGNANACTGQQGVVDCQTTANTVARSLGCDASQVCVLSTGVIGQFLPMNQLVPGIEQACRTIGQTESHFLDAAEAILTTDNGRKVASESFSLDGQQRSLAGMAKGAGMIGPNMATMLAVIVTDVGLTPSTANRLLHKAVEYSFNRISVEGHTSTNDAVILLSSGQAMPLNDVPKSLSQFSARLDEFCLELAKTIPADGEGATRLIEINVSGTDDNVQADRIARTIAGSALVKTAVTGCDPNWGRVISAAGNAAVKINLTTCCLMINGHKVFEFGCPTGFDEQTVSHAMAEKSVTKFELIVGSGSGSAPHWTSNLTTQYVNLNADYRT